MRNDRAAGFTLIEVMVALLVLGLAALALIRMEGAAIRGAAQVDAAALARIVARNVAIEALTDPRPPAAGQASGIETNGGRAWRWTREVRAIGDGDVWRIDVSVADPSGTVIGRQTLVRAPAAP